MAKTLTSLRLDDRLVRSAQRVLGAKTRTQTIEMSLQAVIETERHRKLIKRWLQNDEQRLSAPERERMRVVLDNSKVLDTIHSMRRELIALWQRSSATKEQLLHQLEDWCHRAEASGIVALQDFSRHLRRYQLAPA